MKDTSNPAADCNPGEIDVGEDGETKMTTIRHAKGEE
jgi:hypothetical protein